MNFLLFAYLLEKHGPRLTMDQLAVELGVARNTVYNQVSAGTFPVATYVDGGKRWADARDVAAYFDACRARAKTGKAVEL
jgi:predicted DNA-binding transcriptional regulator AlpA